MLASWLNPLGIVCSTILLGIGIGPIEATIPIAAAVILSNRGLSKRVAGVIIRKLEAFGGNGNEGNRD